MSQTTASLKRSGGEATVSRLVSQAAGASADVRRTEFKQKLAAEFWINISGRDYRLVGKSIRIGRATDNDIVIDHKSVSRYHALISLQNINVVFEDLQSRNGIRVNGVSVKRSELKDQDEIQVGDLKGLFFQRMKAESERQKKILIPSHLIKSVAWNRIQTWYSHLDSKQRKYFWGSVGILFAFVFLGLLSGGSQDAPPAESEAVQDTSASLQVANPAPSIEISNQSDSERRAFERCLEQEDLGNFRQGKACFRQLPLTKEVNDSIQRIEKRQTELSQERYNQGDQAFKNYYFDIAILKWQEVLLIADDASEFRTKALSGIQEAQVRKGLR